MNGHWRTFILFSFSFHGRFKVDVQARIVHDYLTGPYVIANQLGRIHSLKEHFLFYWRMYPLMFARGSGSCMMVPSL
jgi:hypothetical protein